MLGVLEEAGGSRGGCGSYLREQVVRNEGRDLARQNLTVMVKTLDFILGVMRREYDIIWFTI